MKKLSGHANITIEQIIATHQGSLQGLIGARIPAHPRSLVSIEDVLQAVWIEIDRCLPAFEFETERQLGAWIKVIARSRLRDALRNAQAYGRGGVRFVGQGKTSASGAIGGCCAVQRSPSSAAAGQEVGTELLKALQTLSRRDQQIMSADHRAAHAQVGPDAGVGARDLEVHGQHRHPRQDRLDEPFPPSAANRGVRPMHAMEQLTGRDRAESDLLVSERRDRVQVEVPALPGDEDAGVDQVSHGSSGSAG